MLSLYGPQLFRDIGFTSTSSTLLATGIHGCVKASVNTIFVLLFLDRIGRRHPLVVGSVVIAAALLYLGIFTQARRSFSQQTHHPSTAGYVAIAMTYIYTAGYSFSWAIVPFVFASEIFPTRLRALALMLTFTVEWGLGFGIMYAVPYMLERITYGTFYFFAGCMTLGGIGAWLFVPETKGLELEKMHLLFEGSIWARHTRRTVEHNLQHGAPLVLPEMVCERAGEVRPTKEQVKVTETRENCQHEEVSR